MIKGEVITHEGNPGPNWLDHCKNLVTPQNLMIGVVFAVAIIGIVLTNLPEDVSRADRLPATSRSEQSTTRSSLSVEQPIKDSSVQPSTTGDIQANQNSTSISAPASAGSLGAKATPGLNTSRGSGATTTDPNTVSPRQLTEGVQSAVTNINEATTRTIVDAVDGLF